MLNVTKGVFRSKSRTTLLDSTSQTVVYTCPDNIQAHLVFLFVGSVGTSNRDITLAKYDASENSTVNLVTKTVNAKDGYYFIQHSYIAMRAGDILYATAGAANDLTVTFTVEEEFDNTART